MHDSATFHNHSCKLGLVIHLVTPLRTLTHPAMAVLAQPALAVAPAAQMLLVPSSGVSDDAAGVQTCIIAWLGDATRGRLCRLCSNRSNAWVGDVTLGRHNDNTRLLHVTAVLLAEHNSRLSDAQWCSNL